MKHPQPTPISKTLVVCRQIFTDKDTGELALIAPLERIHFPHYPATLNVKTFALWANAHGSYRLLVQLRCLDGTVISAQQFAQPFQQNDPLAVMTLTLKLDNWIFPAPGKYEFVFLANEQEVATYAIVATQSGPPKPSR